MGIIQIKVWHILPKILMEMFFAIPIFTFILNLAGSMMIVKFAGASGFIGMCNLTASVCFGGYVYLYCRRQRISGVQLKVVKILNRIPIIPYISIKKGETYAESYN